MAIETLIEDDYTGDVTPGGPAQRARLAGVDLIKLSVGSFDNNTYLVTDTATGDSVFVDAANEGDRLVDYLADAAPGLTAIVTTHRHPDHVFALDQVSNATGVPTAAHPADAEALPVAPDRLLNDGDTLSVGDLSLEVIHLVGHTPGSIALVVTPPGGGPAHILTGDALFPGGLGKTSEPEQFDTLYRDVTTKIFDRFDDDTVIHPGHGKDTTLGAERPHLTQWRERGW